MESKRTTGMEGECWIERCAYRVGLVKDGSTGRRDFCEVRWVEPGLGLSPESISPAT